MNKLHCDSMGVACALLNRAC